MVPANRASIVSPSPSPTTIITACLLYFFRPFSLALRCHNRRVNWCFNGRIETQLKPHAIDGGKKDGDWIQFSKSQRIRSYCIVLNQWTWWWEASSKKDQIARTILTVSVLVLAIFWYLWTCVNSRKSLPVAPLPPGPRGLPVVGYLPFLGTNLHHSFAELAHHYGPIWKLWLGKKLCVVVSLPSLAKEVSRDHDAILSNRDPSIAALAIYGGTDIVFSPYGSYWRTMRKVFVRDMLSNSSLQASYNLRRDEVQKTLKELQKNIGTAVEIGEVTFRAEFNLVVSMLWGSTFERHKAESIGADFRAVVSKIVDLLAVANVSDFFPVLARFDLQGVEREMKKLVLWLDRILDPIIDARMKMDKVSRDDLFLNKGRKDFLQILLEVNQQEDSARTITVTQMKALMMDIVVGGTETTTTMVEWVMAELMHNPEVMRKVQEELSDVVGMKNVVEESHVPNLHYLDAVVKESLRLHPALPLLLPRRPSQSCVVGGYTIPKDTRVFINVWAMHRDPEFWENPSEFMPERFLSDSVTSKWDYNGNNFQYLPFGSGRRICAGLPLAERMVMYVLASLLHSFNWHLPEGEELDLTEKFGIVMKKSTPLKAIPTPRLSNKKLYR